MAPREAHETMEAAPQREDTAKETTVTNASGKKKASVKKTPDQPLTTKAAPRRPATKAPMATAAKKASTTKTATTRSAPARERPLQEPPTKKAPTKNTRAAKSAAPRTTAKSSSKAAAAKDPTKRKYPRRSDLGAPADDFFARQPPELRLYLDALRALVKETVPQARESMKWGMPYYELKSGFSSLYASNTYAALNIMAPPETLDDPQGKLEGTGKTMRHYKVRSAADLADEASIVRWLKTAAARHG